MSKLIVSIALIFVSLMSCAFAEDCFKETVGYTSEFAVSAFNTYFPDGRGQEEILSFFEGGYTSVDFQGERMRVDYEIVMTTGTVNGSLWGFGKTNQMYILSDGVCNNYPLEFPIPSGYPWNETHHAGNTKIGAFPVDIYVINNPQSLVNQSVLYDKKECAVVSSILQNANPSIPGYSLMNYLNFKNKYEEHLFDLPSECTSTPAPTSTPTTIKVNLNAKAKVFPTLPRSIQFLQKKDL